MKLATLHATFLSCVLAASLATAQEVDIGSIVSDAVKETKTAPAPAPAPAPEAAPEPSAADRALAEAIKNDLADIDEAIDLWAKEKKKSAKTKVVFKEILPYLPPDSAVVNSGGNDRAGHAYDLGTVENGPRVAATTARELALGQEFWGDYAPPISKKEVAAATLTDLKQIRLAILARDTETPDAPGEITFDTLKGYLKEESDLWKMGGKDRLGNSFVLGTPSDPVRISGETYKALGQPREYWGEFAPKTTQRTARRDDDDDDRRSSGRSFGRKVKDFFRGR